MAVFLHCRILIMYANILLTYCCFLTNCDEFCFVGIWDGLFCVYVRCSPWVSYNCFLGVREEFAIECGLHFRRWEHGFLE